jgi:hypothetical protein
MFLFIGTKFLNIRELMLCGEICKNFFNEAIKSDMKNVIQQNLNNGDK